MSAILTVAATERAEPRLRLGAATLPLSFRYADDGADVTGLLGDETWVTRATDAARLGVRGILVLDPRPVSEPAAAELRNALDEHGTALVLDRGWGSSPAVDAARAEFARLVEPGALVESRLDAASGADLDGTLLAHFAVVRAAVAPVTSLRVLRADSTGYDALGILEGGADLALSGVFSDALTSAASVRIVRQKATVLLELGPLDVAAPGVLRVLDGIEERHPLIAYETAHRGAWRRLHAAVVDGAPVGDLDALVEDSSQIASALSGAPAEQGPRVAG